MTHETIANRVLWLKRIALPNSSSEKTTPVTSVRVSSAKPRVRIRNSNCSSVRSGGRLASGPARGAARRVPRSECGHIVSRRPPNRRSRDRKSTRLNSSHVAISYAVFCLKKKKKKQNAITHTQKKKNKHQ